MLLFRLTDLPRSARRLTPSVPLAPEVSEASGDDALGDARVDWMLRPTLLTPGSGRLRDRVAQALALYEGATGQPRSVVDALASELEEILGDYRLARCVSRTIEAVGYHFASPPHTLALEPAALRALCYRRAQRSYQGYVPRAHRAAFLTELAAELGALPEQIEESLWADRAGAAVLRRGLAPLDTVRSDQSPESPGGSPELTAEALQPAGIVASYNAAAVATVLAASSWVTLILPATETAALKELYRYAKALHVGVEVALQRDGQSEDGGLGDLLAVTLYGPGSRALVRGRKAHVGGDMAQPPAVTMRRGVDDTAEADAAPAPVQGTVTEGSGEDDLIGDAETVTDDNGGQARDRGELEGDISVPAPGGPLVAAVVTRLVERHPHAVRDGWARLLGPDHRLFHVPLDDASLAALHAGDVSAGVSEDDGTVDISYDSAVEADFARAFLASEAGGRLGVARGWIMEREPRAVVADGTVFLPDFSFRRGAVEVLCEVVGYYTEDYLTRKKRKLAHLRGRLALLLIVDADRAAFFADAGFPLLTYRSGRQISVTDVVGTLDASFDPFVQRRAQARHALAALCAGPGPRLTEDELCAAVGCVGRTELTAVWSDLLDRPDRTIREDAAPYGEGSLAGLSPETTGSAGIPPVLASGLMHADDLSRPEHGEDGVMPSLERRYVPGYGLAPAASFVEARQALARLLDEAGGSVPLEDAVACCAEAGLPEADDALITVLGGTVVRAGLFGEAQVYRPGVEAEDALVTALSTKPKGRRRRL